MTRDPETLVSLYLHDPESMTHQDFDQLSAWIKQDPSHAAQFARAAFVHRAVYDCLMGEQVHGALSAPLNSVTPDDSGFTWDDDFWRVVAEYERTAPSLPVERPSSRVELAAVRSPRKESRKSNRTLTILVAGCLGLVVLVCMAAEIGLLWFPPDVATVKSSLNAEWADAGPAESGARLKSRREPFRLAQGMVDIVFDKGTEAIIEAPAELRLKGGNRMELVGGRLFATVPPSAKGFTVDTPCGCVVDLGTQFGIKVESASSSDLHLFKGQASLTPGTGGSSGRAVLLSRHEAKQVTADGTVQDIPFARTGFVRKIYSAAGLAWRGQPIDLADLLAGGNGFNTGPQALSIDQGSGAVVTKDLNPKTAGKKGYWSVTGLDCVDGVFVPDGGQGPVVVSSQGHVFKDCPDTTSSYWDYITGRPLTRMNVASGDTYASRFGGKVYGTPECPGILMHANAGVTFDLNKIRARLLGLCLGQFTATCGIVEGEDLGNRAAFWVLVDGEKRAEFHAVSKDPGRYRSIAVPLKEQDRFLTLVTTDDGDDVDHDWSLFGQPYLVVEESP
jgi:ferric-dicitrate binding protein FerR (iron transport regulator)